jgi:molybdopterin molybdotransferase
MRGESATQGRPSVRARLETAVSSARDRRAFVRVRLSEEPEADGRHRAVLAGGQGSHVLSALAAANGLAIIPEGISSLPAGAEVEVIRLDVEIA